jgi:hypothetical protein
LGKVGAVLPERLELDILNSEEMTQDSVRAIVGLEKVEKGSGLAEMAASASGELAG